MFALVLVLFWDLRISTELSQVYMGSMYNDLCAVVGFNEYQLIFDIWIYLTIHSQGLGKDITKEAEINNICLNEHSPWVTQKHSPHAIACGHILSTTTKQLVLTINQNHSQMFCFSICYSIRQLGSHWRCCWSDYRGVSMAWKWKWCFWT